MAYAFPMGWRLVRKYGKWHALATPLFVVGFLGSSCALDTTTTSPQSASAITTQSVTTQSIISTTNAPATTNPPTSTALTSLPGSASPEVAAIVNALGTGWEPFPLGISALGGPDQIAVRDNIQVVSLRSPTGCCYDSPEILAGPIGGPLSAVAGQAELLPDEQPTRQTLIGSGASDILANDLQFLAVGAWQYVDPDSDQNVIVPYTWTSSNGTEWLAKELPGLGALTSVVEVNGRYLAVLDNGDTTPTGSTNPNDWPANAILTSQDGIRWNLERELELSTEKRLIHRIGTRLLIVGNGVELVSDNDGPPWITGIAVADDGTLIAIGAARSAVAANKPVQDYMMWTHPALGTGAD